MSDLWTVHQGDCLDVLRGMESGSVDAVVTDPPYGIGKAFWDAEYPREWYAEAIRVVKPCGVVVVLTNGGDALQQTLSMMGGDYQTTMAAWLTNGMTRGPVSFGNWIAVSVAGKTRRWQAVQDVFRVVIRPGEKIPHPSQKPLDLMRQVTRRLVCPVGGVVLDPFAGSGTTGVACITEGFRFVGIEREADYCEMARQRCASANPPLFASLESEAPE